MVTLLDLLRSVGTEFKVMQELLRHRVPLKVGLYTPAVTPAKHAAQAAVMSAGLFPMGMAQNACWIGSLDRLKRATKRREKRPFSRPQWFQ